MTMTLVSTVTVGSGGAASIDFTSIPQTGTDLLVVLSVRTDESNNYSVPLFTINNDSGSNYSYRFLYGTGTGVGSASSGSTTAGGFHYQAGSQTSNTFGSGQLYIPNYTGSTTKSWSIDSTSENNATGSNMALHAGLWNSTAAITRITISKGAGTTFQQYSTASLYTITKGSGGATVS